MSAHQLGALETAQPGSDFEEFYRRVQPRLLAYVRMVHQRVDAEDVTAETMARALERFGTLRPTHSAWPWLVVVARRLACDAHRAESACAAREREQLEALTGFTPDLEDEVLVHERRRLLEEVLRALPASDARILRLRLVEEMSHEDIAAFVGSTSAAVRQQFSRARRRFIEQFTLRRGELWGLFPAPLGLAPWARRGLGKTHRLVATAPITASFALAVTGVIGSISVQGLAPEELALPAGSAVLTTSSESLVRTTPPPPEKVPTEAVRRAGETSRSGSPSSVTVSARAATAAVRLTVARDQFAAGTTEQDSTSIETPIGTVYVEGSSENSGSGRVVCELPGVQCS